MTFIVLYFGFYAVHIRQLVSILVRVFYPLVANEWRWLDAREFGNRPTRERVGLLLY
jgi:hypothetical protein